jgi:hypothetical protein
MRRKQLYIEDRQDAAIKRIAERRGVPEACLFREAIDAYLEDVERAASSGNPLLDILGSVDDPNAPTDGSVDPDRTIYGASKPRRR